jgi:cell division septation protein DedD
MLKVILLGVISCLVGGTVNASIYDGGKYSEKKLSKTTDTSHLGPDLSGRGGQGDYFSTAPVGKPFYVIGEDQKCYWSTFSKAQKTDEKVLVVFYESPVSGEHCVYQSTFSPKPYGYSLSVKNGGTCVNSHADVEGEHYDWVVKIDEGLLPTSSCFNQTQSYGDSIDRKHKHVAEEEEKVEEPAAEVVKPNQELHRVVDEPKKAMAPKPRTPAAVDPNEKLSSKMPYTLQFSSHATQDEAQTSVDSLKAKGAEGFIISADVKGKTWYRVCVGHFASTKDAKTFKDKLAPEIDAKTAFVQVIK